MKQKIVLFGYPLSHSISPKFQQAALDHFALDISYLGQPTAPDSLESAIEMLRSEDYLGANVTIPHKEPVVELLDDLDTWANTVGAVNTIVKDGTRLSGHNTDGYGLLKSLEDKAGMDLHGIKVLILGSGGAARAAAFALAERRTDSLIIANRTIDRAKSLADAMKNRLNNVKSISLTDAHKVSKDADLIINATSIGMQHGPGEGKSPLDSRHIDPESLVFDMVYTPSETPLMVEAKNAGAKVLGGLWMLIFQGAAAFEMWTSRPAPINIMYEAGLRALGERDTSNET